MKIFAICNSDQLGLPTVAKLKQLNLLAGVSYLERYGSLVPSFRALGIADDMIYPLTKEGWIDSIEKVISEIQPDCVFVMAFPWKIPGSLLNIPPKGFLNFHFGLLPKYKGADPIFWEMKNQETEGGLTVHQMNEEIDEGAIIMQEKIAIAPGMNYGLYCNQLSQGSAAWVDTLLGKLEAEPLQFIEPEASEPAPEGLPTEADLTINWAEQTALEIECLVNAANPRYGGAITTFSGQRLNILEVTPMSGNEDMKGEPGEIVYADLTYGVIVICADGEFVRITVAQIAGAYISGVKLITLGFFKGGKFA